MRRELDPAAEASAFGALKARLEGLWGTLFPGDDEHYTSVVVPSRGVDPGEWGADYDEERLLFLLIRLRNPRARMVYVTSRPIPPPVLDYYFELLRGTPASHLRAHVRFLCAHDTSPRPLSAKLLERPRLLEKIRAAIFDPSRAYLTVSESSPLERRLAVALDLPLNAADPALDHYATRTGARGIFREAGLEIPRGVEGIRTECDAVDALWELKRWAPDIRRAAVRLEHGPQSPIVEYARAPLSRSSLERQVARVWSLEGPSAGETFADRVAADGAVVEEMVEGGGCTIASAEFRINPRLQVVAASTHDHVTPGNDRQGGLWFPADPAHRREVLDAGRRASLVLASHGVVSRVSVTFAVRPAPGGSALRALGIDLGMGPVVHSLLALRFLTGGSFDPDSGTFVTPAGASKTYRSNDTVRDERYHGLQPDDLIDIVAAHRLRFDPLSQAGVLFHVIGGISERGSIGVTAVGDGRAAADRHYRDALAVLDAECSGGGA